MPTCELCSTFTRTCILVSVAEPPVVESEQFISFYEVRHMIVNYFVTNFIRKHMSVGVLSITVFTMELGIS